jgi:hypothetical protein
MSASLPPIPRTRNYRTHALLRHEAFWQIGAPLALAAIVTIGLMIFVASPLGAVNRSPLADVSLILLIIPAVFFGLITLIAILGLIWGVTYGLRELPFIFKRLQDFAILISLHTKEYTHRMAGVVIAIEASAASAKQAATSAQKLTGGSNDE